MRRPVSGRSGFTLIELAIVLAVIGLIVGGVVVGESVLRQAQLRGVIREYTKYNEAVIAFREKYLGLPGDFTGAESLWGSDTNCPNTASNTTPKTATCNGVGDGNIGDVSTSYYEIFRFWQQLSDAGLIDGTFTGVAGPDNVTQHVPGVNVPASVMPGAGWEMFYLPPVTGDSSTYFYNGAYANSFAIGGPRTDVGDDLPVFTPAEAMSIDSKIDDGLPATGFVRTWKSSINPNCTTADVSSSSTQYLLSYTGIACSFKFVQQF